MLQREDFARKNSEHAEMLERQFDRQARVSLAWAMAVLVDFRKGCL